jgi:hypothetical protein
MLVGDFFLGKRWRLPYSRMLRKEEKKEKDNPHAQQAFSTGRTIKNSGLSFFLLFFLSF